MSTLMIRIWANITQYGELTEPSASSSLLGDAEVEQFDYRRLQAFDSGLFYSISYARLSYLLAIHFWAPKGLLIPLKNRLTTIAIVIPRGYLLEDSVAILKGIHSSYAALLKEALPTQIEQWQKKLKKHTSEWEAQFSKLLSPEPQQFVINTQMSGRKGIVAYKDDESLRAYFAHPLRLDFKGARQIVLVPQVELTKLKEVLTSQEFIAVKSNPIYSPKYALSFPDYNPQNAIALIGSLDDQFVHTFQREGYKPIALEGKLRDHLTDWKITQSEDKSTFIIGLKFEPKNARPKLRQSILAYVGVFMAGGFVSCFLLLKAIGLSVSTPNFDYESQIEKLEKENKGLRHQIDELNQRNQNATSEILVGEEQKQKPHSNSLKHFNDKLDGIDYTQKDCYLGRKTALERGEHTQYQKYFDARLIALLFCTDPSSRTKIKGSKGLTEFLIKNKQYLTQEQAKAMQKLLDNKDLYTSCKSTNITTISEMLKELGLE